MKNIFSVGQINRYVKNMFTQDFMLNRLYVKGEVSNCKYHPSGHIYFSLKDESGTIACVMFAGSRSGLSFHMEEGQQVVVLGAVSVYERDGKYQLYIRISSGGNIDDIPHRSSRRCSHDPDFFYKLRNRSLVLLCEHPHLFQLFF